jgi:hypothetical protein
MWLLAGGSVFLPRLRRAELADLHPGDGLGVCPRPMRHKDIGFAVGEPFLRSTKLQDSEGATPGLVSRFFAGPSSGGCSGGFEDG